MMKMRYFRFLYGRTQGCFLHLGELMDTRQKKRFTFLYMQGTDKLVQQREAGHTLFLFPKKVDLLILGTADERSMAAMKGLPADMEVGTVVTPESSEEMKAEIASLTKAKAVVGLKKSGESFWYRAAGWKVRVDCWSDGALAVAHGPIEAEDGAQESTEMGGEMDGAVHFDDCVMSVKTIVKGCRCQKDCCPDEYGCAMGCTRGRDYDACKSKAEGRMPYRIGTVLMAGKGNEEESADWMESMKSELSGARFLGCVDSEECIWLDALQKMGYGITDQKRYFIGTDLSDRGVGWISRSGLGNVPVVLQEEEGICCSGFLKYCDEE